MARASYIIIGIVFVFELIAFGLALGSETRRTTVTWQFDAVNQYYYCEYKLDIASGLAAAGFFFNLVAFLIVMGVTRCFCCGGPYQPTGTRFCAILSLVLLIVCFIISQACFLAGANRNQLRTTTKFYKGQQVPECETISKGIFAAAAAFTFFCWILNLVYYVATIKCKDDRWPPSNPPTVGMTSYPHQSPYSL